MIFSLPNGLQGYLLTDAKNQTIDRGPTDVVVDKEAVKRGRDPEVINGVSCMNCHWSGTLNKSDQIRNHVLAQPAGFYSEEILDFVRTVYVEKSAFDARLLEDRERFEAAVRKCGAQLSKSEPVATLAFQFEEPLDLDQAAAEAGVTTPALVDMLKQNQELARELGSLMLGQPVPRETYLQQYPNLIRGLNIGTFVPRESRRIPETASTKQAPAPTSPTPHSQPPKASAVSSDPFAGNQAGELREFSEWKIKFHWCPPAVFTMGTPGASDHEAAVDVTITRGFWLAETELSEIQWHKVMKTAPWRGQQFCADEAAHPVVWVSHGDEGRGSFSPDSASEYCRRLTQTERAAGRLPAGWHYGLPTEAQWEYACRAGTESEFFFGDAVNQYAEFGWCSANIDGQTAHMVGKKAPNPWGLHDMVGNVREWCADGYRLELPGGRNPLVGFARNRASTRICRGSSWKSPETQCRSSYRHQISPGTRGADIGFRLCLFTPGRSVPSSGHGSAGSPSASNPYNPSPGKGVPVVPRGNHDPLDNHIDPNQYVDDGDELDVITDPDIGQIILDNLPAGSDRNSVDESVPAQDEFQSDEQMELPDSGGDFSDDSVGDSGDEGGE